MTVPSAVLHGDLRAPVAVEVVDDELRVVRARPDVPAEIVIRQSRVPFAL